VAIGPSLYWLEADMSFVIAAPEMMTSAATDLATIGSNLSAAHTAAAASTVAVLPAAADEVSTGIAHLFSQHAQGYQTLAAQAAAFQGQFVHHLTAGAFSYASIEAAIASLLQDLNVRAEQLVSLVPPQLVPFVLAPELLLVVGAITAILLLLALLSAIGPGIVLLAALLTDLMHIFLNALAGL
jgi:PE family